MSLINNIEDYFKNIELVEGNLLFAESSINDIQEPVVAIVHEKTEKNQEKTAIKRDTPNIPAVSPIAPKPQTIDKEEDSVPRKKATPEELVPQGTTVDPKWKDSQNAQELHDNIKDCKNCQLGHLRKNFVFGSGNPNADIMIIGEAPGKDEDEQGKPFVGRAGQLLTKILEAINFKREDVFICNILKCRPPGNRDPEKQEVAECEPYLQKQIELINPEFILVLGRIALNTLMKGNYKMGEMRGKVLEYHGKKMLVTYHPAALLRNPNWKRSTWEDVQKLRKMYDEFIENKK
jgi:uracil-DNA glycosylase family 4